MPICSRSSFRRRGLEATTREYKPATLFALPTTPEQRPDLLALAFNADAAYPDTWTRAFYYRGGAVNLLGCSVPGADKSTREAAAQQTREESIDLEAQAGRPMLSRDCCLNVTDVKDAYAATTGISGFEKELPWAFTPLMAALTPPWE